MKFSLSRYSSTKLDLNDNQENFLEKIISILFKDVSYDFFDRNIRFSKTTKYYEITYGQMYKSPNLNFAKLKELSVLFGTDNIDVDDFANSGCESCDWGSNYGHDIQIYSPTQKTDLLDSLCEIKQRIEIRKD